MLAAHLSGSELVRQTFSEASEALGCDMRRLVLEDPDGNLDRTEFTQPALLTASIALLRLWRSRHGGEAGHVAGHSLGEYSGLVAAGSLDFTDAVRLVAFRGRVMSEVVREGEGRMAAILGLEDGQVEELCRNVSGGGRERVWPANYNCPGQLVIAGHAKAVEQAMALAREMGARRVLPLAVSVPSHTPLMQPAAEAIRNRLREIRLNDADRPVWSNVSARPVQEAAEIRASLEKQLVRPVLWTQTIGNLHREGVVLAVEMGPGKVLAGLTRRIARGVRVLASDSPEAMELALAETTEAGHE
jgi:[acyl-carrier-protein] S-malonyltransferase